MLISIVTINYNNAPGFELTFQSVSQQSLSGYELIVIEGASLDTSVDVIRKYEDRITYWKARRIRDL